MKKKINLPFIIALALMAMSFTTASLFKDDPFPISNTGAPNFAAPFTARYCNRCHGDFAMNTAGSVVATGLPSVTYTAGQVYNFTIKITGPGTQWGFAIKAVNTVDNANVGVLSTTNASTIVLGTIAANTQELGHGLAVVSAGASYTYINLKWTAPVVPTANESNIRFYITGVAGDGNSDDAGDYVYTTTLNATLSALPVTLNSFKVNAVNNNAVNINWQTAQEINTAFFEVETSSNSIDWIKISTVTAKGNSDVAQSYSFTDKKPIVYNSYIYYRLKIVDRDGAYKYSAVELVKLKNAGIVIENLSAQPLQAYSNGYFKVHSSSNKTINISVYDMNGSILHNQTALLREGTNHIEIPGDKLAKTRGIILIKFAADGFQQTFKQIIQ